MKSSFGIAASVLLLSASAFAADSARVILRDQQSVSPFDFNLPQFQAARPMNFGLSAGQLDAIAELTAGKIDLRGYRSVDQTDSSLLERLSKFAAFVEMPNVPPPVMGQVEADPQLKGQWWIDKLNVEKAWPIATGKNVVIADCDAGFYWKEPDLEPNMLSDLRHDFADKENPTLVDDGGYVFHGTAVAAIMASVLDGKGTNGIAFDSKIVPFQNYNYDSHDDIGKEEATAACILQAIQTPDVKIIVLENQTATGSSETFPATRDAVRLALKAGITIVSAGGNYSHELTAEAADNTQSIIVGALAKGGDQAGFSNYGDRIAVAAFGEQLHTLYGPNGAYGEFSGTSGATPQVAGTVALMISANPSLTPEKIRNVLINTRVTTAGNKKVGGMLDTFAAVSAARSVGLDDLLEKQAADAFRARLVRALRAN